MMTDQIPLDLAPPPLLNGDVPLMPHMVNGDAVQQVNNRSGGRLRPQSPGPSSSGFGQGFKWLPDVIGCRRLRLAHLQSSELRPGPASE